MIRDLRNHSKRALVVALLALLLAQLPAEPVAAQDSAGTEPANIQVVPGDGVLTVTWTVTARAGVADDEIRHALRWSQVSGVWANPQDPRAIGRNDGISLEGGQTSYTITGLQNGVATGVFVRSFTGGDYSEGSAQSSQWVRVKGAETTPQAPAQSQQQQSANCPVRADGDYDSDDDGLIEVCNLSQLHAITWDMSGDGNNSFQNMDFYFPNAVAGDMGCPATGCIGYELTVDLDFDTNGDGQVNEEDELFRVPDPKWYPNRRGFPSIGYLSGHHALFEGGIFEGNGHTISNLYINDEDAYGGMDGLFTWVHPNTVIRNLGLIDVNIASGDHVGGLAGKNEGTIINCYVTGKVSGKSTVGGLVGLNQGTIINSWADVEVTGTSPPQPGGSGVGGKEIPRGEGESSQERYYGEQPGYDVGGLVGYNAGNVRGSYAVGDVSGKGSNSGGLVGYNHSGARYERYVIPKGVITASYAAGSVSSSGRWVGGLVGSNWGRVTASYALGAAQGDEAGGLTGYNGGEINASYWNSDRTRAAGGGGVGQTTTALQTPTGYAGIYAAWNVDWDGDGNNDAPWEFGTDRQYPVLKRAGPSVAKQREQIPPAPLPSAPGAIQQAARTYAVSATATATEGTDATLTLSLSAAAPAGGAAFTVTAGYGGSSTATADDVGSITSPVTVTAGSSSLSIAIATVGDAVDEEEETFSVTVAASTAGWEKEGDGKDTATVTIQDDDSAGVTVTPTTLNVSEGGSGTYTVVLDSQPTHDVTITPGSSDGGAASFAPASYTFTPSDWNRARTFTVSGVADDDADNESVTITHSIDGFQDARYNGVSVSSLTVTVEDTTQDENQQQQEEAPGPPVPGQTEPYNIQVTPGDGTLTVTWTVAPREGVSNDEIRHALRWSQVSGVWANPRDPRGGGPEDGIAVEGGVASYTITGLENGAATGVFVRSLVGSDVSERSQSSSQWVRVKGEQTTPRAGQPEPVEQEPPEEQDSQQQATPKTFAVSAAAAAAEGSDATLTVSLSEAAPAEGVQFTVSAGYGGGATATAADVGSITSPVTVTAGSSALGIAIPTVDDAVDEEEETFTVTVAAATEGWEKAGDGQDTATVTIQDDDSAGVTVSPTALNISEGGSATYTVVLDSQPTADVTVTPGSSDGGAASFAPASYTFTPSDWNRARSFTVSGVADDDYDDESVTISHGVASGDGNYNGITSASAVSVAVADSTPQPARTYSITAAAGATEGGNATLTVTLSAAAPAGGVALTVTAGYDGGSTATAEDVGGITSPVTVTAGSSTLAIAIPTVGDAVDEEEETFTVTVAASTEGWEKAGDGQDTATITISDDDSAGVTVNPTALKIAEDGSATYTVVLNSKPTHDVTVTPTASDGGAASFAPASYVFTPSGWNRAQTFTVSGVADADSDNEAVTISHGVASGDGNYNGIAAAAVSVAVADSTPQAAKTYSITDAAAAAEGTDATLTVTLSEAAPAGGVQFTVAAGYDGASTATAADVGSITSPVSVAAGGTSLEITIPTAADDVDEEAETFTVTIAATTEGWEKAGDGKDTATVTIQDDDSAGVTVSPTALNISEGGSATYTVVLTSRSTVDVTVMLTASDGGAASIAPASYIFTPSGWNRAQTFTVSGVADEDSDDESVTISHVVVSTDSNYHGIAADSVAVSVSDSTPPPAGEPPPPGPIEPANVQVTPGDGTLTVTWTVAPREGFENAKIKHALRWSQAAGVWANPTDPKAVGPNDGISVEGGVASYTITGLQNGVATGVFVRSFTGGNYMEGGPQSSQWVRVKGDQTTPRAAE